MLMGRSINVTVTVRNLSPTYMKVGKVEVLFDWNDTYSVQRPMILQPGQEYGWNFPSCHVPSDTRAGDHSFRTDIMTSWAQPSGNWSNDYHHTIDSRFVVITPLTIATERPSPLTWLLADLSLLAALVIGVVLAKHVGGRRMKRMMGGSRSGFLLFLVGVILGACLASTPILVGPYFPVEFPIMETISMVGFATILGGAIGWLGVLACLWLHHSIQSLFEDSVVLGRVPFWRSIFARVSVGGLLNLAYWTVIYYAPWRDLLKSVLPVSSLVERFVPENYAQFSPTGLSGWLLTILVVVGGTATIYAISFVRLKKGRDRGRTTITLLQILCYLALFLFAFSLRYPCSMCDLSSFVRVVFLLSIPGAFASVAIIEIFERFLLPSRFRIWT